ncbi:MAG: DUF5683 domain-containing protein [Chitinispirillia bacterium]|nr:DUF5683 domain-containing protein [Chitinispirillia bacterium]
MSRRFFIVSFFTLAFAFNMALAQNQASGTAQGVVLESVDEDIVDDDDEIVSSDTQTSSTPESAETAQQEKSDDDDIAGDDSDELDIDKLLAGDEEEDLLADDKPLVKESDIASKADSASADSEITETADSEDAPQYGSRGRQGYRPPRGAKSDPEDVGPAIIEDGRSINFAHNLSEYRSPRLAMLLSLLVPGLGQAYSKSYIKAGAFAAVEIAAIGTAISFNNSGKSKKREAHRFADRHFSIDSLKRYDGLMRPKFEDEKIGIELPFDTTFYNSAVRRESFFYESIRGAYFAPGWIDLHPVIDDIVSNSDENPFEQDWFGSSRHQATYNSMMKDSKSKHDAVNYVLYVILVNHIASAIDAGFTARAYNANLLGKDNTVWERISVEQQYVFSGKELSPGIALRLKF